MESALYGIFTLAGFVSEISDTSPTREKIPYARAFHEVISIYYIKVSGTTNGNKLIKTIRYPHMGRYDILTCEDIDDFADIKFVS